jgi:PPM family protein phosphatase
MRLESWSDSKVGLVRKSNEDSVGHFPERGIFIVADGMGGHAAGEVASRIAVEAIEEALRSQSPAPGLLARVRRLLPGAAEFVSRQRRAALRGAVELANRRIREAGEQGSEGSRRGQMGSTVVALKVDLHQPCAYWAHVGDSRLYRARRGSLALLTADNTVYGQKYMDQGPVPLDLPHTNVLLQALGISPDVKVTVASDGLEAEDVFLLCSDGVSGLVDAPFIQEALTVSPSLAAAGEKLIQGALVAGGNDNASLILVRVAGG